MQGFLLVPRMRSHTCEGGAPKSLEQPFYICDDLLPNLNHLLALVSIAGGKIKICS